MFFRSLLTICSGFFTVFVGLCYLQEANPQTMATCHTVLGGVLIVEGVFIISLRRVKPKGEDGANEAEDNLSDEVAPNGDQSDSTF